MVRRFESDASRLRHVYWHLRASRTGAKRRAMYRAADKEKARLRGLGWAAEAIRLYCLWLIDPDNEKRRRRFEEGLARSLQMAFEF